MSRVNLTENGERTDEFFTNVHAQCETVQRRTSTQSEAIFLGSKGANSAAASSSPQQLEKPSKTLLLINAQR